MWILAIALTACLDTNPACEPADYVYVASFATLGECQKHIKLGDDALHCLPG